jgi:hypothetical protein
MERMHKVILFYNHIWTFRALWYKEYTVINFVQL